MRTLVTVRKAAEVEENFELDGLRMADQYLDCDLNEWDKHMVEEAVQVAKESDDDMEIVAVTIGPKRLEETIRMVLAKGVDRVIRVWDDALDGVDLFDVAAKIRFLSVVVEDGDPDLVLTGVRADGDGSDAIGVSLASAISFEWVTVMNTLGLNTGGGVANARHELEGGVEELTGVSLPAVLTTQTGINEPCYANLCGIRRVQSKEIKPLAFSDFGLDAMTVEPDPVLTDIYEPETESDATYFEGDAEEQAADLVTVLREKGVGAQ